MEQNDFNTTRMDSRERLENLYLQPGDVIAGNYEFVRELGRGGMGVVCLCRDLVADGRLMAVKTVPDILRHDDEAVVALTREYDNMYELRHDNIVSVRHLVKDDYRYYVVMDYAEGETLAAFLSNHRKPGEVVVLEVIRRIATALDYAHGKGMVHRDIKPGNVMVQIDGDNVKSVKLLDFGLGLQIRKSFSRTTGKLTSGTPAYKSPEQWEPRRFGKPSFNSDQYSLAAMAYEMLSGNYPFAEFEDMETFRVAVWNDAPERIDGIADYRNDALRKALAKKPEDRFENCLAFANALVNNESQQLQQTSVNVNASNIAISQESRPSMVVTRLKQRLIQEDEIQTSEETLESQIHETIKDKFPIIELSFLIIELSFDMICIFILFILSIPLFSWVWEGNIIPCVVGYFIIFLYIFVGIFIILLLNRIFKNWILRKIQRWKIKKIISKYPYNLQEKYKEKMDSFITV